jgi:hypothetical protein
MQTHYKKDCFSLSEEKYIRTDGTSIDVKLTLVHLNMMDNLLY